MDHSTLSSSTLFGRIARYPLRLLPDDLAVPILQGPLRGTRWIVGSSIHGCWLGSYESEKQIRIAAELKPGSVFYDVGANVGFYSLLAAPLVTTGSVFAFEPLPRNVRYLRKHLELNRIRNVEVLEMAICDRVGAAYFQEAPENSMGFLAPNGSLRVATASVDSLVGEGRLPPPTHIKIDVEGAELLALQGARESIERYRPVIFLATHGREIYQECCALLKSWGYQFEHLGKGTSEDRAEVVARYGRQSCSISV